MKHRCWILGIAGIFILGGAVYGAKSGIFKRTSKDESGKMRVAASFYPLAHFAEQVGGAHVEVANITPAGAEPHDYEPTPQQVARVYDAKVLFAMGGGIDPWAERIKDDVAARGVEVLIMYERFGLDNPHFWLDAVLAQQMVGLIRDTLTQVDPAHEVDYRTAADGYIKKLELLDRDYRKGLTDCASRDVVTTHDAFEYFGERYQLNPIPIAGLSPEEEPSSQRLAEIARLARERHIKYIFFETLVSPRLAETIAREVGAQTLALNTLEGLTDDELREGKTYLSVMEENLANLRTALQCR